MLGISIYPYKENEEETMAYIELAAKYGYQRVFTNLLMIEPGKEKAVIAKMKKAIACARKFNMEVILDVNPAVFDQLGISYQNLAPFKEMGATGLRLDMTFDGLVESLMTFDQTNLDLEINISNDTAYLENILSYQPDKKRIIGCHNFYPQRFTGLDYDYFVKCSKKYKALGLKTAAFVNSQVADHGPHVYTDGLCTVEMHRDWPIVLQAKHLFATGLIDDVIIANAYASEAELKAMSEVNSEQIEFNVEFTSTVTPLEKEIVLDNQHLNRGDINSYSIRSTFVKLKYADQTIEINHPKEQLALGDITIGNNSFGQYKGEVNIVKQPMPNHKHEKNNVAKIIEEELFLLSYIHPWSKFRFKEVD
ncbi:MupG family TIM beta-alpha barrel fold protein [Melissococcus plutonius]|uniref:Outer surface protein n=1 Tax=Melissococcus plutonius TaxID=33970 RepID=A0A2Z5Y1V5_9ENTE|nr:MupG family TIM beta-alpha barrel fold protein [Melissococcus plutonius]BAL61911.1 hypothetical protein MPD5_0660 [Melissococcus plutonius DAT561]MCV2499484.1 MupG family TIM beta-alpha barrel fold protein [Melissococcus plutonius]MCV2501145.1 MupG family TIM beta-alpha barrel fold protein [Melissococcus plutonius]MCV2505751.1 MupG family TIM beta-alpha barrel fold protein [Melissococcus plutonius]MCV2508031.1 MupG family TIM beta-alpha barrel fold protein [Melissococcus plutonius]